MYFLLLGLALLGLKYAEIGPVAAWSWWLVLAPFAAAVAWWSWADATGYTKKKAMERFDARVKKRHDSNREAMGLGVKKKRR